MLKVEQLPEYGSCYHPPEKVSKTLTTHRPRVECMNEIQEENFREQELAE